MNWPSHRSNQDRWHELIKQALFTWMSTNDETVCTGFRTSIDVLLCLGYNHEDCDLTIRDYDHQHHSERGSKNPNPECSRIKGGGSMSVISTCCIVLEMSSTENGMLHLKFINISNNKKKVQKQRKKILSYQRQNPTVTQNHGLFTLSRHLVGKSCLQHCWNPQSS